MTPRPGLPPGPGRPGPNRKPFYQTPRFWIWLAVLVIVYAVAFETFGKAGQPTQVQLSYTAFQHQVEQGNVKSVTSQGDQITGQTKKPVPDMSNGKQTSTDFTTVVPQFAGGALEPLLQSHHVEVTAQAAGQTSILVTLLETFGPILLLIIAFVWLYRRQMQAAGGGGIFSFGRSKARLYDAQRPATTFADVAGIDEVREELREVVDFLKNPDRYRRLGGTIPKGVLLIGPPGAGKTLIAKAVAGEAGVPFFSVSAAEFVEMIVGVGASRVRDLFQKAVAAAPAIIFIDELDAIGRKRAGDMSMGGHNEQEQTLNQILTEMDGFNSREGVTVLAATNRADVLDEALLRPGRFDRRVSVHPPDRAGRAAILAIHTRNVPLNTDVKLQVVASETPGLVGADLRNLVNEAALMAAGRGRDSVTMAEFQDALEKIMLGRERHLALSTKDRQRIAYHEAGHALVALLVPNSDPVRLVSILPRGQALGVTLQSPVDDRLNYAEDYLRARITSALGGRAAEEIVYQVGSTGAENDLQIVSQLARNMVMRWGMSKRLGPFNAGSDEVAQFQLRQSFSEATSELIDTEIRRILDESYQRAHELLIEHRPQLDELAHALVVNETMDETAVLAATGLQRHPEEPEPAALHSTNGTHHTRHAPVRRP
ncbi:MAG: ATP-dependent zinc metalloprotease FtsH [Candidatus Dormiibacterota bacterium]